MDDKLREELTQLKWLEEGVKERRENYLRKHQELMYLQKKYNEKVAEGKFDDLKEIQAEIDQVDLDMVDMMDEWREWQSSFGEEG